MMYRKFLLCSALSLRMMALLLEHWYLLMLILYFFVLPVTPHLSLGYDSASESCLYLGSKGVVFYDGFDDFTGDCPLLILLNATHAEGVYGW